MPLVVKYFETLFVIDSLALLSAIRNEKLAESEFSVAFLFGDSAKQNVPGLFQWTAKKLDFYNWLRQCTM